MAERLRERYSRAKLIDVEVVDEDGKLNPRGREWWAQLSNCTYQDFKAWNLYFGNRLSLGEYFPNVQGLHMQILQAREIGMGEGIVDPTPPALPAPDTGVSSCWRERMVRQIRQQNPQWEKQAGEESRAYGMRMLGEIGKIDPAFARALKKRREGADEKSVKTVDNTAASV